MKTTHDVKDKLRFLLELELAERFKVAQERRPEHCLHNHRERLDNRRALPDGEPNPRWNQRGDEVHLPVIGLCMYGVADPENWEGTICDEPETARACPVFQSVRTKEDVLARFVADMTNPDWLSHNRPYIAALWWVLGEAPRDSRPWWRRWVDRWFTWRIDPLQPSEHYGLQELVPHLLSQGQPPASGDTRSQG